MNKLYTLLAIAFIFLSCKSDDETKNVIADKIIEEWTYSKSVFNGTNEDLSNCDKKQTWNFRPNNTLLMTFYVEPDCEYIVTSTLQYSVENNIITYSNPTGGHNGGEFTRKFRINSITDDKMELDLIYEVDGIGEEGNLNDRWVTTWVK